MPTEWTVRAIMWAVFPVLLTLMFVELGSGLVLGSFEAQLSRYPSLLVLIPITIGTAGNLRSVLMARLPTPFHLGTLSLSPRDGEPAGNAVATLALAMMVFPVIGTDAWVATLLISGGTSLTLQGVVLVVLSGGVSLTILAVVVTSSAAYPAYRFGLNPDNTVIPVVTNLCDMLGVVVLFGMAQVSV